MNKKYMVQRTTFTKSGTIMVRLSLYQKILDDGTDLGYSYAVDREPIHVSEDLLVRQEEARYRLVHRAIEDGISELDIGYSFRTRV